MKRYVYIEGYDDFTAHDGPDDQQVYLAFRYTILEAADEDEAYRLGARWSDAQPDDPDIGLMNDLVVEIPE